MMIAGKCYYIRSNGSWLLASATSVGESSVNLLVMATSTNASTGLVTRGVVFLATDPGGSVGGVVYLSTTSGDFTSTPVSSTGNVNRVVGYKLATNIIMFNPSQDWIEIS